MALNPYQTLGVADTASQDEIKKAYRDLAKKFHPDLNPGSQQAEARFKEINAAYDLLSNPDLRAKFDRGETDEQLQEQMRRYQQKRGPFYSQTRKSGGRYSGSFGDMDDDILRSIFEQMQQSETPREEMYRMEIDFKDSILGTEREITLPTGKKYQVKIPPGVQSGNKIRFGGNVYVELTVRPSAQFRRHGDNLETEATVPFATAILGGEITVATVDGQVLLKVPPAVGQGQKLRVKGKGVAKKDGTRGDQFVLLKIEMPKSIDEPLRSAVAAWRDRHPAEA